MYKEELKGEGYMTIDEIRKSEEAWPKVKSSIADFLSALTKPEAIEEASKKTMKEKLEKGEIIVGKDESGIYFMKKQEGKIEKTYEDKSSISIQQSQDLIRK